MKTATPWIAGAHALTGVSPHKMGGNTHRDIVRCWLLIGALMGGCGIVLYGVAALKVLLVSIISAVASDMLLVLATRRPPTGRTMRAALMGLLLGLTLPATAAWYIPLIGSAVAIFVGQGIFGGFLHPALVGRVIVQAMFASLSLAPNGALAMSPVLAPGKLLVGDINNAETMPLLLSWQETVDHVAGDAILQKRPVQNLRSFAQGGIEADGDLHYEPLIRDILPPWRETLLGVVPGGIGETCGLMLIVGGLFLIYRGYLRWQLPVTILLAAVVAAAVFPAQLGDSYRWFPAIRVEDGRAVGLAYVLYHITSGQLLLGAFLLSGNLVASPMRVQGQILFGVGIGALTIFMRLYGVLEGECYWSILIMNALVGSIDRRTKRRVLGTVLQVE